ncbi:MAG: site-specific integrase [Beggiatoa sp.]|nr:site-specific integrase [Beggiatoa sp.]
MWRYVLLFSELKTKASRRRVDLPGELVAELRRWRLQCPPGAHDLVLPSGAGNPENHGNLLNRGFYPALRRAGLRKIRFHDLRHTYPSLLIANGEHPKRIQALMGHSSTNVTMDMYGHLMPGGGGEVADRLGALVFRFW